MGNRIKNNKIKIEEIELNSIIFQVDFKSSKNAIIKKSKIIDNVNEHTMNRLKPSIAY